MGLARQRECLAAGGLTPGVIATIQGARALSTQTLYDSRWKAFHKWCLAQSPRLDSFQAPISEVLRFLQDRVDAGLTFSTIKVWLHSISACHMGYDGKRVSEHPWVPPFLKGVKRLRARSKGLFPAWDLPVVLDGLCKPPFEPLESADLKFLTLKTVLLVALTTTKRVSDIQALSVSQECLRFSADGETVWLKPNSDFVAKNLLVPDLPVELKAFRPPDRRLHCLCPVRALRLYLQKTSGDRASSQLFVSFAPGKKHSAVARCSLSRWIVEAIRLAYTGAGATAPEGLRAHSTRAVSTSWAVTRGVPIQEVCMAANWSSPSTFVAFYNLDVSASTVAHTVLGVANTSH